MRRKAAAACAGCGYPCAPDFAFCPRCGSRSTAQLSRPTGSNAADRLRPAIVLPSDDAAAERRCPASRRQGPTTEADRRTVTVLFADLSGFTALSEQLDPEVMQALQNELFEELTAAVQSFGGFVDKFIGDALLACSARRSRMRTIPNARSAPRST